MRFTLAKAEIKIDAGLEIGGNPGTCREGPNVTAILGLERDPPGGQLLGLARPTISSPIHR